METQTALLSKLIAAPKHGNVKTDREDAKMMMIALKIQILFAGTVFLARSPETLQTALSSTNAPPREDMRSIVLPAWSSTSRRGSVTGRTTSTATPRPTSSGQIIRGVTAQFLSEIKRY